MSTWNYRVLKKTDRESGETIYAIHEVYYNEAGKPEGCTENSVAPMGESLEELKERYRALYAALSKPVLIYDSLEEIDEQQESDAPLLYNIRKKHRERS